MDGTIRAVQSRQRPGVLRQTVESLEQTFRLRRSDARDWRTRRETETFPRGPQSLRDGPAGQP